MAKNSNFGPDFGQFWPNLDPKKVFSLGLPLLVVIQYSKLSFYAIKKKLVNQTKENSEKPNFGGDCGPFSRHLPPPPPILPPYQFFSRVLPLLNARHCHKLSSYAISRKTYDPNSRKCQKNLFSDLIRLVGPKFGQPNAFFQRSGIVSH